MLFKLTKAGAEFINNPSIKEGDFVLFQRTLTRSNHDHLYRGHLGFLHWMQGFGNTQRTVAENEGKPRNLQVVEEESGRYTYVVPILDYRRMAVVYNKDVCAFRIPLQPMHVEAVMDFDKPKYILPRVVVGVTVKNDPGLVYPAQYAPEAIPNTNAIEVKRFGTKVTGGNAAYLTELEEKNKEFFFPKEIKAISINVLNKLYQGTVEPNV